MPAALRQSFAKAYGSRYLLLLGTASEILSHSRCRGVGFGILFTDSRNTFGAWGLMIGTEVARKLNCFR